MTHTNKTILSLSTALLLCSVTLVLAAPPADKGKPPKGNQSVVATADFTGEDIFSDVALQGELINNGDFDILEGQLTGVETIRVRGDAARGLDELDKSHSILPPGVMSACSGTTCEVTFNVISNVENSGATWTIRLDRDKDPSPRVQFKMRWVNEDGFERHLRIGWVVQFLIGEELTEDDYGEVTNVSTSLESAEITFDSVLFRIDGDVKVPGRGKKKTELVVFSRYGETSSETRPWCNMGIIDTAGPCVVSATITTTTLD